MAEVFEAEIVGTAGFARQVAIKRMLGPLSADPAFAEMFVNEARIASLLHHPNVVAVLDFDRDDDGQLYLAMEMVKGVDLRSLADTGRVPVPVAAHVIGEVLRGLAYAHELVDGGKHLGIVHRDISPHNVMLSWSGAVKIVDFGIAKAVAATNASRSGSLKGKVAYMSPEQAHGSDLDGRSDVFAVGVMFHELLTGRRLFDGGTEAEILAHLLTRPIPRPRDLEPKVPEELDHLCMAMLERDVQARVLSARVAMENMRASPISSVRGSDDLRDLLRVRFSDRAPAAAELSGPVAAAAIPRTSTPVPGPAPLYRSSQAMRGSTATAPTVRQTPPKGDTRSSMPDPAALGSRRNRRLPWLAAGLGLAVAAAAIAVFAVAGQSDRRVAKGDQPSAKAAEMVSPD
ncbi:MAG: serine/threonine protein kinase, partial [Deltaproteobacteria bacterium]|nr:serine/threonine protein kinase [Deltaproteobacteria bacterium]